MFENIIGMLREALSYSLSGVFLSGTLVILAAFLFTLFLKEIPLRTSNRLKSRGKEEDHASGKLREQTDH
jgi:hypothetical protein